MDDANAKDQLLLFIRSQGSKPIPINLENPISRKGLPQQGRLLAIFVRSLDIGLINAPRAVKSTSKTNC